MSNVFCAVSTFNEMCCFMFATTTVRSVSLLSVLFILFFIINHIFNISFWLISITISFINFITELSFLLTIFFSILFSDTFAKWIHTTFINTWLNSFSFLLFQQKKLYIINEEDKYTLRISKITKTSVQIQM